MGEGTQAPIEAIIFMQEFIAASQAIAHMRQVSLMSACDMHSFMHARHIATQASSIGIIVSFDMLMGRIIIAIMVWHMSAHIAHIDEHLPMPSMPPIMSEHIMHACIAALHGP